MTETPIAGLPPEPVESLYHVGDVVQVSGIAKGIIVPTPGTLTKYHEWNVMFIPSGSITTCTERLLKLEYRTNTQTPRQAGCIVVPKEE